MFHYFQEPSDSAIFDRHSSAQSPLPHANSKSPKQIGVREANYSACSSGNNPAYYSLDSFARKDGLESSRREEDIKDEATAICMAADLAARKAVDTVSYYGSQRTSSSRQRIRELLDKQKREDERSRVGPLIEQPLAQSDPFKRDYGRLLWLFR